MLFPGVKKLATKLDFYRSASTAGGYVKNTIVYLMDGSNKKVANFVFPDIDEAEQEKITEILQKNKIKTFNFKFNDDSPFELTVEFAEHIIPYSMKKIEAIINAVADVIYEAYPDKKVRCGICNESDEVQFYKDCTSGGLAQFCRACYLKTQSELEQAKEEDKNVPKNYLKAGLGALVFSWLGIAVTAAFIFGSDKIAAISTVVYILLAQKAYEFLKGKIDKVYVLIIAAIAIFDSYFGIAVSWFGYGIYKFRDAYIALCMLLTPEFFKALKIDGTFSLVLGAVYFVFILFKMWKSTKFPEFKEAEKIRK